MNNKPNPDRSFIHFMLRAQQLAQQDTRSDKGYAMLITSIISIAMFSMLAAYMTMTNLSKSSTNAYVDGTNTFYAAESGLNRRAEQLRQKFVGYSTPQNATGNPNPALVSTCFPLPLTTTPTLNNDFECRNYPFKYNNNIAQTNSTDGSGATVLSEQDGGKNSIQYTAFTFVKPKQNYTTTPPTPNPIPAGQTYAGLNALEYRYTVYSTAAKPDPLNPSSPVQQSDGKTVLQMDFKSRIVPLFQFAVFYDGDLEMNSSSNMTIGGRVHTNGNFYVQPNTTNNAISTTFLSPITTVGSIYNRVDSAVGFNTGGITRVLMTGANCTIATNCVSFPAYAAANRGFLTAAQLLPFGTNVQPGNNTGANGVKRLETPPPGFLRKRNYFNGQVGEYYAKADMRLEMVPDRDVTAFNAAPAAWTRDTSRIPFNFTSITTAATGGACTTAAPPVAAAATTPSLANDPAANYIAADRNNAGSLRCNVFTKGQLQSLRQPVLVLTSINQTAALQASENNILGRPGVLPALPVGLSTTVTGNVTTRNRILRALQVALASTSSPLTLDQLGIAFSPTRTGTFRDFQDTFIRLISNIPLANLPIADRTILSTTTPNAIAALGGAWFLPAPIQRVETNNLQDAANNPRRSGFYDGRERRWIGMLQTNIASLSVWNRDGLYVEASDNGTDTLRRLPYVTTDALEDIAFNGTGTNTDGLAFDRAATPPAGARGLQTLGLGSIDNTEGGLVFHATVSDDLDGDGVMTANDVSLDIANPIYKRNATGNLADAAGNLLPVGGTPVTIDYARRYRGGGNFQSPFGFAFNGGDYLPGPLTLVTDQAIYVQGNFNNNAATQPTTAATIATNPPSPNRLPASIVGDTIAVLSNECVNNSNSSAATTTNHLGVPVGQLDCGLPRANTGSVDVPVAGNTATYYPVTGPTAVNAAFLSNTDRSIGDLPDVPAGSAGDRGFQLPNASKRFSGALNNYMRMLEDWNNGTQQYFNYSGSFVSLGTPLEFNGAYVSGGSGAGGNSYYNIPARNFNFDANFNVFTSLPPLPPRAIYLQQEVFKRAYNNN